jgi:putative colanic acid biosynthesis UDP-glucose lipid carrier transferase
MQRRDSNLTSFFLVYDIVLIAVAFLLSLYAKFNAFDAGKYYWVLPIIVISWVVVRSVYSHDNYYFRDSIIDRVKGQLLDFLLFSGMISFIVLIIELKLYSRLVLFGTVIGFFVLRNIGYLIIYQYLWWMRKKGRHVSKILVLGAGRIGEQLMNYMEQDVTLGYKVVGFLDDNPTNPKIEVQRVLGRLSDLEDVLKDHHVDEIVVALPLTEGQKIMDAIELSDFHGLRVRLVPDYYRMFNRNFETSNIGTLPVINLRQIPLDHLFNAFMKRSFDVVFSSLVLVFAAPFLMIIGLLIVFDSRGPIFYRPIRIGEGGRKFKCWKFRTMYQNEDPHLNTKSTVPGDARITRIGATLRKYNLDEVPQFINVLRNEMSVVGPRPHRAFLNEHMQKQVEGYMVRHYIKPGITGWAQVNGWRGPTETYEQKSERTLHDLWYIENWSFWLDLEIVVKTVFGKKTNQNAF